MLSDNQIDAAIACLAVTTALGVAVVFACLIFLAIDAAVRWWRQK